jgi:hypothetical protein
MTPTRPRAPDPGPCARSPRRSAANARRGLFPGPRARRLAAGAAALGAGLLAAPLAAEVRVHIEAEGACPAPADLEREVGAWSAPEADQSAPRFRLRTRGVATGARLELVDPAGRTVLTRTVASADCQALARAFALIAHAHFLELGLVRSLPPTPATGAPRPPPAPPGPPGSSPNSGPVSAPNASTSPPPASATPPTSAAPAASAPPAASASPLEPPPDPTRSDERRPAQPKDAGSLALALGPGLALPLPDPSPSPLGFLDLTARPPPWQVDLRLGAWLSTLTSTGEEAAIKRRFGLMSLTAGRSYGRSLALRPEAGFGLLWSSVDARVTAAPSASKLRPALKTGLSLNYALSKTFSIKTDIALHFLPLTDRYLVNGQQNGQGPRVLLLWGVGLEGKTAFW